jgi:hypothetical protein
VDGRADPDPRRDADDESVLVVDVTSRRLVQRFPLKARPAQLVATRDSRIFVALPERARWRSSSSRAAVVYVAESSTVFIPRGTCERRPRMKCRAL